MIKYLCIAFLLLTQCRQTHDPTEIIPANERIITPCLLDTFDNLLAFDTASIMTVAEFNPMYQGKETDTLLLSYWTKDLPYLTDESEKYRYPDSKEILLKIDTNQFIGSVCKVYSPPPPPPGYSGFEEKNIMKRGPWKSCAVFVKNNSPDTLLVGYGYFLPIITEAKDSFGQWKPIQFHFHYMCGTGLSHYYLPPSEIMLTSCKIFSGPYATKLRLRFGDAHYTYSEEFSATIHPGQFIKPEFVYW